MRRTTMHGRLAGRDRSPAFSGPWYELRAMIVRKAADDYIDTMRGLWKSGLVIEDKRLRLKEKLELERFFYSKWYDCLCDVPPDKLICSCIIKAKELEREAIERKNKQEVRKLLKKAV